MVLLLLFSLEFSHWAMQQQSVLLLLCLSLYGQTRQLALLVTKYTLVQTTIARGRVKMPHVAASYWLKTSEPIMSRGIKSVSRRN